MGACPGDKFTGAEAHTQDKSGLAILETMTRSATFRIALSGLLLFIVGFLLVYGQVAWQSGSWRYTITHDDEYAFWVIADGFAESPRSDGNPFYAEHMGQTNPILSYPIVALVGAVSGWLGVSVLAFLPLWKIAGPFLAWLMLWQCLTRIWGYDERRAAAVSLCVMSATLLVHGAAQHTLFRFSRPIDALGPAALWLSCAMNPAALRGRTTRVTGLSIIFVVLVSPYMSVFCAISTWCAWLWNRWVDPAPHSSRVLSLAAFASASGIAVMWFTLHGIKDRSWMQAALALGDETTGLQWFSVLLSLAAVLAVSVIGLRTGLRRCDKILLCILIIELVAAHVEPLLGQGFGFSIHRYYFLIFELLAVLAWLLDRIPARLAGQRLPHWETVAAIASVISVAAMVNFPATNFLRLLLRSRPSNAPYDNSLLLLQLSLCIAGIVWVYRRTAAGRIGSGPGQVATIAFVATCFATWRPQLQDANRAVPFSGAHTWLSANARSAEVVITLPPDYGLYDYAPLISKVKLYYNPYPSRWLRDDYEREYRKSVYFALYCGILDQPGVPVPLSLADRLREFRLDYVLAWKGPLNDRWRRQTAPQLAPLHGSVDASVQEQLGPFLQVVYEDDSCVLWKLQFD